MNLRYSSQPRFSGVFWAVATICLNVQQNIFFTDADVYESLIWMPKLHVPKIDKIISKLLYNSAWHGVYNLSENNKHENQNVSSHILYPSTCYSAVETFIWSKKYCFIFQKLKD